jgi:hypothetical protein
VVKQQGTRAIIVTDLGKQKLREQFGIQMEEEPVFPLDKTAVIGYIYNE